MVILNTRSLLLVAVALSLGGCLAPLVIDPKSFAPPTTAVIVDIPKLNTTAVIGSVLPSIKGFHFTGNADYYFLAGEAQAPVVPSAMNALNQQSTQQIAQPNGRVTTANIATQALVTSVVGSIIDSGVIETNKKSKAFGSEILKRFPSYDLHADFKGALREGMQARGVRVTISDESVGSAPHLRWPATDQEGKPYPSGDLNGMPAVDADVLIQVSPVAIYQAQSYLGSYHRNVSVGIAIYNGRTKKYIGAQVVRFKAPDSNFEYGRYENLVDDLPAAAPALRDALLSLVPTVADIVTGRSTIPR